MRKATIAILGLALLYLPHTWPVSAQTVEGTNTITEERKTSVAISGYIQPQFQWGQPNASLRVGTSNANVAESFSRVGIRRGRIKLVGQKDLARGVLQIDATEKGVALKDAYLVITDPWLNLFSMRAGVFDRPFGIEIGYSSAKRESPERALITRTLFPDERDLGVMLSLQGSQGAWWHGLRLDAGLFAGNGIERENDNQRDFIGRFGYRNSLWNMLDIELGGSFYRGGVLQGTGKVYRMQRGAFALHEDPSNRGAFALRQYAGFDALIAWRAGAARGEIRIEYIRGLQPGTAGLSNSPNSAKPNPADTYIRPFEGGYAMLTHSVGSLPCALVAKVDWYDPNTKMSSATATTEGDIAFRTLGVGLVWDISDALRALAYYDTVHSEPAAQVARYSAPLSDDSITVRLQYKF